MKAAVCRKFNAPLTIEDLSLRSPGPDEVRVRLAACAICHSDITYIRGHWGGTLPAVYGHEAAGHVIEAGINIDFLNEGAPVLVTLLRSCGNCFYCLRNQDSLCEAKFPLDELSPLKDADNAIVDQGLRTAGFAEEVIVHKSQIIEIPVSMAMDSACLLACGVITGVGAVRNVASVVSGSSVVTIGVGGVGINCIQGAFLSNVERNIAIDLDDNKLKMTYQFGATDVVNAKIQNVNEVVRYLTNGRGADYVFVAAGSPSAIEQSTQLIRRGGMVVLVGMTAEGVRTELEPLVLANDAIKLIGSKMGSSQLKVDIPFLIDAYNHGLLKLDELISHRFPLSEINSAILEVEKGLVMRNVIIF
ncbi:MAG: zinc-binding dehydrogenase [Acidiferrobacteraceae bacterium]|nr:zinc-binding dehydrogenase [Acidiferrobacteraceae bacterium]